MQVWVLEVDGNVYGLYANIEAMLVATPNVTWTLIDHNMCEGHFDNSLSYCATPYPVNGAE